MLFHSICSAWFLRLAALDLGTLGCVAAPVLFRHPSVWGSPHSFAWLLPLSTAVALGRRSALRPSVVPPLGRVRPRSIRSLAASVLHRSGPRMLWSPVAPFFGCSVAYCRSGARIGPVPALGPTSCRSLWSSIILLGRFCARAFDFRVFVFHLCLLTFDARSAAAVLGLSDALPLRLFSCMHVSGSSRLVTLEIGASGPRLLRSSAGSSLCRSGALGWSLPLLLGRFLNRSL